jgi:hypothetical protein
MKEISRDDLKAKLDRGDDFKLVMTLAEWAYEQTGKKAHGFSRGMNCPDLI